MTKKLFKKGDRVKAKVMTMCGWKGTGIVMEDQITEDDGVKIWKDDYSPFQDHVGEAEFMPYELQRIKK